MPLTSVAARALEGPFFRFCVIGALGFLSDAAVLMTLVRGFGVNALEARLVSFACAVLITFELNRQWTFRDAGPGTYFAKLSKYLGVQSLGFGCNFSIYAILYMLLPASSVAPVIALAVASIAALFLNYFGARLIVFRHERRATDTSGKRPNSC